MAKWELVCGKVEDWTRDYAGPPFHLLFCDPPYHLQDITQRFGKNGSAPAQYGIDGAFKRMSAGFMGQAWDGGQITFLPETWAGFYPYMLDGAFGVAFSSSRNWHRMAVAIEDAGFFIHDTMFLWVQGQGMPKGTRIDRMYQEQRHGWDGKGMNRNKPAIGNQAMLEMPLQERLALWKEEKRWQGHRYGLQSLAPRVEPILIFQKPWSGTQRDNVIQTGAGAMNVDGCRVSGSWQRGTPWKNDIRGGNYCSSAGRPVLDFGGPQESHPDGRWPSNFGLVHTPECVWVGQKQVKNTSGSKSEDVPSAPIKDVYGKRERVSYIRHGGEDGLEIVDDWECVEGCPARRLGEMSGESNHPRKGQRKGGIWSSDGDGGQIDAPGDAGTASRYFPQFDWRYDIAERLANEDPVQYIAKVGSTERDAGLGELPLQTRNRVNPGGLENEPRFAPVKRHNHHPTLKPISLTRWLATLFLPPDGFTRRVIVPFAGVMSEAIGCLLAGWDEIVAIEMGQDYCDIGRARMAWWEEQYRWGLRDVDAILKVWSSREDKEQAVEAEQLALFG